MAKKSAAKRIARLEGIALGMGFLLLKLEHRYGHDFGEGMSMQVKEALRDYRQLAATIQQREQVAQEAT